MVGKTWEFKIGLALVFLELAKGILNVTRFIKFILWQLSVWTGFR